MRRDAALLSLFTYRSIDELCSLEVVTALMSQRLRPRDDAAQIIRNLERAVNTRRDTPLCNHAKLISQRLTTPRFGSRRPQRLPPHHGAGFTKVF